MADQEMVANYAVSGSVESDQNGEGDKWKSVWCNECGVNNIGECLIHGGDFIVAHDNALPSRAILTLPKFLTLKSFKGQRGVFAKKAVCQRTLFGPLEAMKVKTRTTTGNLEYQLTDDDGTITYLDVSDESKSNWMMFVRCASSFSDQNLSAFQINGEIYFAAGKHIATGSELKVWYMAAYAKSMGKEVLAPHPDSMSNMPDTSKDQRQEKTENMKWPPKVLKRKRKNATNNPKNELTDPTENLASGRGTRVINRQKAGSQTSAAVFECSLCGSVFGRPSQLVSHQCLEDRTGRRRKRSRPSNEKKIDLPTSEVAQNSQPISTTDSSHYTLEGGMTDGFLNVASDLPNLIHTGEESDACTLNFNSSNLSEVLVAGSGVRGSHARARGKESEVNITPFECSGCGSFFADPSQLSSHICKKSDKNNSSNVTAKRGRPRKIVRKDNESMSVTPQGSQQSLILKRRDGNKGSLSFQGELLESQTDVMTDNSAVESKEELNVIKNEINETIQSTSSISSTVQDGKTESSNANCCRKCFRTFSNPDLLRAHVVTHTEADTYKCEVEGCGKVFSSKFKYFRHATLHFQPQQYKCNICSTTFNRSDHLKNHLLVHDSNRETYTCEICGKSYLYMSALQFHKAKHEANEGQSLRCLVCSIEFETRMDLKSHVETHNRYKADAVKTRTHKCSQCEKLFISNKDLRRHMVTHTKDRPFLCEHCPQTFVRKDHLRRHYTTHHKVEMYSSQLKINPYGCRVCLKVFKKQKYLDYHMKDLHPYGIQEPEIYNAKPPRERKSHTNSTHQTSPKSKKGVAPVQNPEVIPIDLGTEGSGRLDMPITETVMSRQNKLKSTRLLSGKVANHSSNQDASRHKQLLHSQDPSISQYQQESAGDSVDMLQILGLQPVQTPKLPASQTIIYSSESLPVQMTTAVSGNVTSLPEAQLKVLPLSVQQILQKPLKQVDHNLQQQQQLQLRQDQQIQIEIQQNQIQPQTLSQQQQQQLSEQQQSAKETQQLETIQQFILQQQIQQQQQQLQQQQQEQQQQQQQSQQHLQAVQNFKEETGQSLDTIGSSQELLLANGTDVLNLVSSFDPTRTISWSVMDDLNKTDLTKSSVAQATASSSTDKLDKNYASSENIKMTSAGISSSSFASNVMPVSDGDSQNKIVVSEEECQEFLNSFRFLQQQNKGIASISIQQPLLQQQQQSGLKEELQPQQPQQQPQQSNELGVPHQGSAANFPLSWPAGMTEYSTGLGEISLLADNSNVAAQNVSTTPSNWVIQLPLSVVDHSQLSQQLGIQQHIIGHKQPPQQQPANAPQLFLQQHHGQAVMNQQQQQPEKLLKQHQNQILQQQQQVQTQMLQPQ